MSAPSTPSLIKASLPRLMDVALLFLVAVLNIDRPLSRGELIAHESFLRFLMGSMTLRIGTLDARRAKKMEMDEQIIWLV